MRGVSLSQGCDKSAQRLSQGCAEGREINQKRADASENNENPCGVWGCRNDATKVHRGCRGGFLSHYTLVALGMPSRLLRDAPYFMFRKCSFSDIYELVFLIDFASIVLL